MRIIRLSYEGSHFNAMYDSEEVRNNLIVNINERAAQILVNPKDGKLCSH